MYHPFKSQIVEETKTIITKRLIIGTTSLIVILKSFLLHLFDCIIHSNEFNVNTFI